MSATPNADIPPSEEGWLRRLKNILLEILNAVGDAASHLFHTLWPHVVNAWTKARNFGKSRKCSVLPWARLQNNSFNTVIAHRWRIITLVLGVILPLPVAKGFVAGILGFTATGVRAGIFHINV